MSTPTLPASAHIIDWESVAALCPSEWQALVVLAKKLTTVGKTPQWLGEIAKALQWDDFEDTSLAEPIAQAVEALCEKFNSKTQLTLSLCFNESNCGEEGDDLNPGDGYLDIGGWMTLSPAAVQFQRDYPAARVNQQAWTVYNG